MAHTPEDILKEAILLEKRGKEFYRSVAEKSDSPAAKEIFEMMAVEEEEHIKFLVKQFQTYEKTRSFTKPDEYSDHAEDEVALKVLTEDLKKQITAASFEAAAIGAAIDFEGRAVKLYSDRANEAVDPNEKEIYRMLAVWESGHQKMLHEVNEDLKESIWNDNNFWSF